MIIDEKKFPNNMEIVQSFANYLILQGKKEKTVDNKLWLLKVFFDYIQHKKADNITRLDIENFIRHIKEQLKPVSQNTYIVNLKMFINFLAENSDKFNKKRKGEDYFKNIKLNKQERDTSEKEYLNREDIIKMLPFCKCQRDRALLFLLWDTGGRISEILSMNVNAIRFGKKYTTAVLNGKTGTREVVISSSLPDLQLWLNQYKATGAQPLFNTKNGRLQVRSAQNVIEKLVTKAGIAKEGKKTNLHSTRHGRITELSEKVPEMHLRKFAGWTADSDMPAKYIHIQQKQVDRSVLLSDGYTEEEIEEEVKPETSIKPIKCTCGKENPFDSMWCASCHAILNEKLLMDTREQEIEEEKKKLEDMKAEIKAELGNEFKAMREMAKKYMRIEQRRASDNRVSKGEILLDDLEE